ncbi:hypothetical protein WGC63_30160, partial [Pseudomonas aeruginosa]
SSIALILERSTSIPRELTTKPKKHDFIHAKRTFRQVSIQLSITQKTENTPKMIYVRLCIVTVNQNIIKVDNNKFTNHITQNMIH